MPRMERDHRRQHPATGKVAKPLPRTTEETLFVVMLQALRDAEVVMRQNIYPKPDVQPDHPYAVLTRVRTAIAKAEHA